MSKEKLFKHKTFNQQLAEVKISYFKLGERRVGEKDDDDDEQLTRSYLYSALEKWIDLDCTEDFSRIIRKLGGLLSISTLPQVLNRKEELIKIIHDELELKENPSLNSLLELLIAFAKDLDDKDFYPYFKRTFKLLINQLWTKNVEIIENVFLTLAYLFKILWKCMINDIESIFQLYSDNLLNEQKHDYIVMFSSQSFAFLLRKFETKYESYDQLLNLMFDTIILKPNLINGIGYLLFEVIKGVKNQLNSSAQCLLAELIDKQNEAKYANSIEVRNCVDYFFNAIVNYVDKNYVDVIWSTLIDKTRKQFSIFNTGNCINNTAITDQTTIENYYSTILNNQLSILQIVICFKNCILVNDSNAIIKLLNDIYCQVSCDKLLLINNESTDILNNIIYELLENKISMITVKNIHLLIESVIKSNINHQQKFEFFNKLSTYNFFSRDVQPALNNYLNENNDLLIESSTNIDSQTTLNTLLKLILARQLVADDFKLKLNKATADCLYNQFLILINNENDNYNLNNIWRLVVILPTIDILDKDQLSNQLCELLVRCLSSFDDDNQQQRKSFLIYQLQRSLISLKEQNLKTFFNQITPELYIDYLNRNPTQLPALTAFKFYLDYMKKQQQTLNDKTRSKFEDLFFNKLQHNLSHQHSQMRKVVLEILIYFTSTTIISAENDNQQQQSIFNVCLMIENVNYNEPRECQRLINKLDYLNQATAYMPSTKNDQYSYRLTPVYYLLGIYYINYTPFWEAIKSVLINYAINHKNSNELWTIIYDHIKHTDLIIYESKFNWIDQANHYQTTENNNTQLIDNEILKFHENDDRPDYFNHRIQLINLLVSTTQLVEKFNRHFVQWFFEFLNREISTLSISSSLYVEDITRSNEPMDVDGEEMNDDHDNDDDEQLNEKSKLTNSVPTNRPKVFQTFLKFLKVFSNIKNPLAIYEESKLRSLYYQLLESKDTNIQKAAFDCLKTYRFSYLTPYVDNIIGLIDNNQFKNELVKFNFASRSSSDSILQDPHRKDVIPIIMRILYGKLIHNFSSSKEGLVDSKLKKKLIFRYISDYKEDDIRKFIEIAFSRFENLLNLNNYQEIDSQIDNQLDLKSVIPCKQLYASLENLLIILDNLGAIFPNLLTIFYKLIIIFLKYSCKILAKRDQVKRNSLHLIRQVRANCFKCLTTFFKTYPNYNFKSDDIDVIFETDLERTLLQLPVDSLNYINPQLRLYLVWSEQMKFFKILGKKLINSPTTVYPLKQVMIIYDNRKADSSVIELITKIIHNLLIAHLKEDQVNADLEVNNVIDLSNGDELGASLLVPFIDTIIERFEQNMNRKLKNKKSFSQNLVSEVETNILIAIGKYVNNEESCFRLIKLLISSLQRNIVSARNEEADQNTLNIIHNLSLFVKTNIDYIITSLEPFFDLIKDKNSRIRMCQILNNLSKNDVKYQQLSSMIGGLNAYSRKVIDSFDVEKQLDTCNEIKQYLQNDCDLEQNILFINLIIKNCVFFIKTSDDYAVRSECLNVIQLLIELIFNKSPKLFNPICIDCLLLREVRFGLRCENDTIKQDFITILRYLINKGKSKNRFCEQMSLLSCEDDVEQDFWINIFSIQYHQRTKAVTKLLNQDDLLKEFPIELITMFIMPMILNNVFDKNYSHYQGLKESSISLLGKLSKHLNWSSYVQMLIGYLKKLSNEQEDHKTIIKVICAILNNFKFDLNGVKFEDKSLNLDIDQNVTMTVENDHEEDEETTTDIPTNSKHKDKPEDILKSIVNVLLPKLHQTLNKLAASTMTYSNDKEKKFYIEDEEILRLPIAIAMVKLLKSLPDETKLLENNIRNIILRIVNFLKSRAQSIRDSARSTLVTVLKIIGPYYLNYVLIELRGILKRGYMFHVLTFTIYSVLNGIADQLKPLDIESCIDLIVEICNEELFSDAAEEKEIDKITNKTAEAKKTRSYDVYRLIGKYISTGSLVKVYLPLKQELTQATDHKVMNKIDNCLQKLCIGIVENRFIDQQNLFLFLYGSIKDTIPALKIKQEKAKTDTRFERMQSLLIEPVKQIKIVKSNIRTNMHLMMLHYLQILHLILKRTKLDKNTTAANNRKKQIEPFIPILINELSSKDPQLIAMSLRCLRSIILKFNNIQDADQHYLKIKNSIFILLNKYGSYIKGENLDMKALCFKMMIVLLNRTNVEVNDDQLKILLFYCDQDILDDIKQAQAFALLNAILDRKLDCEELRELMIKLREILVQSDIEHIRQRCRNSWFRYFLNYIIGNQLQSNLLFFTRQLDYEKSDGRVSVLRMLLIIVKFCPNVVHYKLIKYSLIPLALRFANEENILCRKLTSKVLFNLLLKVPELNRTIIFKNIFLPWFESDEESIKQLGCHMLGLMCDVEKEDFIHKRASYYMQTLIKHLEPSQYLTNQLDSTVDDESLIKKHDHLIFTLLIFVKKQLKVYPQLVRDQRYSPYMNSIWKYCDHKYLAYPHLWIRITALQLFDQMLAQYTEDEIINTICHPINTNDYLLEQPLKVIWHLTRKTLFNLSNIYDIESQSDLVCKHLTLIQALFGQIEQLDHNNLSLDEDQMRLVHRMNIDWLFKRIVREIKREIRIDFKQFIKRKIIYTWLREVIKFKLTLEQVESIVDLIMYPLVRDLTDRNLHKLDLNSESNNFATAVQRVFNAFKKRLGQTRANQHYSTVLLELNRKRIKRKSQRAIQVIMNPMKAIKLRQRKRIQSKRSSKKRKSNSKHSGRSNKRRRTN